MQNIRKQISKRLRFDVFKRDDFTCQYCSAKPPRVPLEIDHIKPVSKGGKNVIDNLITACFDCNRGKSNIELTTVPMSIIEKKERLIIAQSQYLEYKKVLKKQEKIINDEVDEIETVFHSFFDGYIFNDNFKMSVKKFIKDIGFLQVKEAMEKACSKMHYNRNDALKYFCGICWNNIKQR